MLTRTSVHCADRIVATSSSHGEPWRQRALDIGIGFVEALKDGSNPVRRQGAARRPLSPKLFLQQL